MHRWPRPVALVMFDKGGQSPADLGVRALKRVKSRERGWNCAPPTTPSDGAEAGGATDTAPQPVSFTTTANSAVANRGRYFLKRGKFD